MTVTHYKIGSRNQLLSEETVQLKNPETATTDALCMSFYRWNQSMGTPEWYQICFMRMWYKNCFVRCICIHFRCYQTLSNFTSMVAKRIRSYVNFAPLSFNNIIPRARIDS